MYTQVTEQDFIQAFVDMNREDNFSRGALVALYNWFIVFEEDTGESVNLDVVTICCEFSEMTFEEVRDNYSIDEDLDVLEFLEDNTIVIGVSEEKVIIQDF